MGVEFAILKLLVDNKLLTHGPVQYRELDMGNLWNDDGHKNKAEAIVIYNCNLYS